jgi:hypothetical protein
MPDHLEGRFYMQRMSASAALEAIRHPAARAGTPFTDEAARELVRGLRTVNAPSVRGRTRAPRESRFVEPVQLQVVCLTLWDHLPPDVISIGIADVQQFGDVDKALSEFYETTLKITSHKTRVRTGRLRAWFEENLITSGGTRACAYRGERETEGLPEAAVKVLVDEHLVRSELRPSGSS